jgi:ABC-type transport system involved in Fe-S cluster assembly fused permease/ATPase subunit
MGHIMALSLDFHSKKDTGEVLKAMDQAGSLNNLVQLVVFQILPIVLDFVIAIGYVTRLFDMYLTLVLIGISAVYISLGMFVTPWIQHKERVLTINGRTESRVTLAYEAVSN